MRELEADEQELAKFTANVPQDLVEAFATKDLNGLVVPVPSEHGVTHEVFHSSGDYDVDIANLVGYNSLHYKGAQSMQAGVDAAWEELNSTFLDASCCGACGAPEKLHTECNDAGMCLCTLEGKACKSFKKSVDTELLKARATAHSPARVDLKDGRWAIIFRGEPMNKDDVDILDVVDRPDVDEIVLHVGYQKFSPWRSSWQVLCITDAPVGEPPSSDNLVYTKAPFRRSAKL